MAIQKKALGTATNTAGNVKLMDFTFGYLPKCNVFSRRTKSINEAKASISANEPTYACCSFRGREKYYPVYNMEVRNGSSLALDIGAEDPLLFQLCAG